MKAFVNQISAYVPAHPAGRVSWLNLFAHLKAIGKSQMLFHHHEYLHSVFASEAASRFFITFMMRFMQDSNGSSDDSRGRLTLTPSL